MGVLYTIALLDDDIKPWLRDENVAFDEQHGPSRYPCPRELRRLPDVFNDLKVSLHTPAWDIMFEGKEDPDHEPWTLLHVSDFGGDESTLHSIWFEKGWPSLILRIVHVLSAECGPLVIVPDTGCKPIVVHPQDDPAILLANWEHAR